MEWKKCKISDLGIVVGGATPSTRNPTFYDGNIPWISPKDLSINKEKYIKNGERNITKDGYDSCSCKMLPKGSVLFSSRAPIGYIAIAANELCTNQGFKSVIPNERTDSEFLYYLLKFNKDAIASKGSGTTFMEISGKTMSQIEVMVPATLSDQRRIASILSSLDAKIETNNKINAKLEEMAQALFRSWLESCKGQVKIVDLAESVNDTTKCEADKVVLINSSDVTEGHFDHNNLSDNKNLKGHFKRRFKKGDILYSQVRPRNRHWAYCQFNPENYLASTQLMIIRNKPEIISSSLLYQYIVSDVVWMDFTNKTETRSGTFPQGNFEELSSIQVPFGAEIKYITIQLDAIRNKIYNNYVECSRLAQLRDTLLPKLMNGEIEL